jgi:hypothetical protein
MQPPGAASAARRFFFGAAEATDEGLNIFARPSSAAATGFAFALGIGSVRLSSLP